MTVQPSQPAQVAPVVVGSDKPYRAISGPAGELFQVTSLRLEFNPTLTVWPDQAEPTKGTGRPPTHMVSCGEVKFQATVHFTGRSGWEIGWAQTVEPSIFWVRYRDSKTRVGRHLTELRTRMRDGDSKGPWYDSGKEAVDGTGVRAEMSDDPNLPFYYSTFPVGASLRSSDGTSLQGIEGLVPRACGGQKEFWAWLLAFRTGAQGQPSEAVYLHHVHWRAVFDGQINTVPFRGPVVVAGPASGAQLIAEGVEQGAATPVLDGSEAGPEHEVHRVEMESL